MIFRHTISVDPVPDDMERVLRERKPTADNRDELLSMMEMIRAARRHWIANSKPDATTIIKRYPRLLDMNDAVSIVTGRPAHRRSRAGIVGLVTDLCTCVTLCSCPCTAGFPQEGNASYCTEPQRNARPVSRNPQRNAPHGTVPQRKK